ncbi:MAG: aminotransferase class III-fold pyridoxal phosphate-dependent enzyme [Chloroflexi bacterium]|nr:aminotransferase class III-fold pyridoxal phosphate-dependent enzyme [Chloroflexota bacterium]MBI4504759.1 aminotransferase class III-fold pyridoxal phosphate-dependent enzyme [Chloroflexota bacterium]
MPGGSLGTYVQPDDVAFVVAYGRGSKVYDVEGREYIDYILGSGPAVLGHAHPAVVEAVQRQVERGTQFYWLNEPVIALADKMVQAIPCAEMVKFTSSGAEATFYALRLARAFTGRDKIMRFEGSYHGHHDYSMLGGSAGIPKPVSDLVITAPFNDLETTTRLIEQHRHELAAVIVEALMRIVPPKPGFLEGLRAITKQYGIMLIFDEVVTGFRLAWGGAQERYGVTPDLASYGKIIGGGYPFAAVAGRADLLMLSDPRDRGPQYVYFSGTFSGNPLGATAGLATLRELEKPGAYARLDEIGERLRQGLREIARTLPRPMAVLGDGPIVGIAFVDGDLTSPRVVGGGDKALLKATEIGLLRHGVLANIVAKFYVSLAHDDGDLDRTLQILDDVLHQVCRQG